jgi:hypothetical protein
MISPCLFASALTCCSSKFPFLDVDRGEKPSKPAIGEKLRNAQSALEPNVFSVKRELPFLFA